MYGIRLNSALAALLFFATSAHAEQTQEVTYAYYLISCGSYIQHRTDGTTTDNANTADLFYVAGWLSAYNRLKADRGVPEDTPLDDVMLWLEHYCQSNPLSNLETGLFKMGEEVSAKQSTAPAPATPPPAPANSPVLMPPPANLQPRPQTGLKPLPY